MRDRDLAERSAAVAKLFDAQTGQGRQPHACRGARHDGQRGHRPRPSATATATALERNARGLFETLRSDHRITHLYFTGPDRINLYRLHTPAEYGDSIDRATMLQAHMRKQPVHGLELGPLGTLTLRLVMPWRQGAGSWLRRARRGDQASDRRGTRQPRGGSAGAGRQALSGAGAVAARPDADAARQGDWERFSSHVALAQTTAQLPAALDDRLLARLLDGDSTPYRGRRALPAHGHGAAGRCRRPPIGDAGDHARRHAARSPPSMATWPP